MNKRYVNCVGTELFLEPARPRAATTLPARGRAGSTAQGKTLIRLSLSQRERIKVRDSSGSVLPRQSKSPEGRYQVLREPDDSKNERRQFRFCSEIAPAPDRMLREGDSHDLSHPTRQQVSQPDNKNLLHNDRWDAGVEIYNARNFDFEDGAIECVRSLWRFCGGNEHESLGERSSIAVFSEKINRLPLTLILSPQTGRGESHLPVCTGTRLVDIQDRQRDE